MDDAQLQQTGLPLVSTRPATVNTPASALTLRQRQIVLLICDGLTAKDIAARLDISPKTVEFHKHGIHKKFGLHTVAHIVRWAIRVGLIEP